MRNIQIILLAALLLVAAGCQRVEPEPAGGGVVDVEQQLVITASIADAAEDEGGVQSLQSGEGGVQSENGGQGGASQTKVTYADNPSNGNLVPAWEVGDALIGILYNPDDDTYSPCGFRVAALNPTGSAVMTPVPSGSYADVFGGTAPDGYCTDYLVDGATLFLIYAPGKTPADLDMANKKLVFDISSQAADAMPALMTATGRISVTSDSDDTSRGTMSAVFHSKLALLSIKGLVMDNPGRTYSALKLSGPTSTSLNTKVTLTASFADATGGVLKASYGTKGVITKEIDDFTADAYGNVSGGPWYIALCPVTTSTALTLSTLSSISGHTNPGPTAVVCALQDDTYPAGSYRFLQNPVFGHPWVEIGGVKWATMNVGATSEAGGYNTCAGDWFAWGATDTWYTGISSWGTYSPVFSGWIDGKSAGYAQSTAQYYDGSAYTKYISTDGLTVLDTGDDPATVNWGNGWRTPTKEEFAALYAACGGTGTAIAPASGGTVSTTAQGIYWCTDYNGVKGLLFVQDATHKVFFPATSCIVGNAMSEYASLGDDGYYWSSSLNSGGNVDILYLWSVSVSFASSPRHNGYPVRPVVNELSQYPGSEAETLPEGALPGVFTVSAGGLLGTPVRVRFSKGNLQATYHSSSSSYSWDFAEHQYDVVGSAAGNTTINSQTDGAKVDLFGWVGESGTGAAYGINTSTTQSVYGNSASDHLKSDWGVAYCTDHNIPIDTWWTPSYSELDYILQTRTTSTVNGAANARFMKCKVNGMQSLLLFPDVFTWPTCDGAPALPAASKINATGTNWSAVCSYTKSEFATLEAAGCVLLPGSGWRRGSTLYYTTSQGTIWSSSTSRADAAWYIDYTNTWIGLYQGSGNEDHKRWCSRGVRLVTPVD